MILIKLELSSTTHSAAAVATRGMDSNKNSFPVNELKWRVLPCRNSSYYNNHFEWIGTKLFASIKYFSYYHSHNTGASFSILKGDTSSIIILSRRRYFSSNEVSRTQRYRSFSYFFENLLHSIEKKLKKIKLILCLFFNTKQNNDSLLYTTTHDKRDTHTRTHTDWHTKHTQTLKCSLYDNRRIPTQHRPKSAQVR